MFSRFTAALVSLFLLATSLAGAADKPLRTMSFDINYSVLSSSERNEGGVTGGGGSGGAFTVDDSGTMNVTVIAATADGGLVVDASFEGKTTQQAPIRIAVFFGGRLAYDPKFSPSPQVLYVLPMLARGMFQQAIEKGESWTTNTDTPAATTTYRVMDVANSVATVTLERDLTTTSSRGYQEHETGTLRYATDTLAPIRLDLFIHSRRATLERIETADTHLLATLKSDSFAKKTT